MTATLLAIDTATDACTLALSLRGERRSRHEVIPRQHQQQLFTLLAELLDGEALSAIGLDAIVFGRGPGSFTGLRLAASAAQGLAFSLGVPTVGVSTLEAQVNTYLRSAGVAEPCLVASAIDARIGQVYSALYRCNRGAVDVLSGPRLCRASELDLAPAAASGLPLHCVGTGFRDLSGMPAGVAGARHIAPELLPQALDMLAMGERCLRRGEGRPAAAAVPDYLQSGRGSWKTLAEQGPQT